MTDRPRFIERNGPWSFFFLVSYVGAAIYFISHTNGQFWSVVLALLEAIVWRAFLIYHSLALLKV